MSPISRSDIPTLTVYIEKINSQIKLYVDGVLGKTFIVVPSHDTYIVLKHSIIIQCVKPHEKLFCVDVYFIFNKKYEIYNVNATYCILDLIETCANLWVYIGMHAYFGGYPHE